jgi:hypothetical protein
MRKWVAIVFAISVFAIVALVTWRAGWSVAADRPRTRAQELDGAPMSQKKFAISKENIRSLVPSMGGGFATDRIMVDGKKVGYMYREAPDRPEDSGWRFFAGDEDEAYIDDPSHTGIYAVNTVANYDPDIIPYLDTEAPCAFEKIEGTNKYRRVKQ